MAIKYSNNAKTTLTSAITDTDTSITVADASVFPALAAGDTMYLTLSNIENTVTEITLCTAIAGNVLTVERGYEGTTAQAWSIDDVASSRLTAGMLDTLLYDKVDAFKELRSQWALTPDAYFSEVTPNIGLAWDDTDPTVITIPWGADAISAIVELGIRGINGIANVTVSLAGVIGGRVSGYCLQNSGPLVNISGITDASTDSAFAYLQIDTCSFSGSVVEIVVKSVYMVNTTTELDRDAISIDKLSSLSLTTVGSIGLSLSTIPTITTENVDGLGTELNSKQPITYVDSGTSVYTATREYSIGEEQVEVAFTSDNLRIAIGTLLVAAEQIEVELDVWRTDTSATRGKIYVLAYYQSGGPPATQGIKVILRSPDLELVGNWWLDINDGTPVVSISEVTSDGVSPTSIAATIRRVSHRSVTSITTPSTVALTAQDDTDANSPEIVGNSIQYAKSMLDVTNATTSTDGWMSATDKTKLDGIAAGATVNSTDAELRDRSTHTGTQAISTIDSLQTELDSKQDTLVSGTNIKTINNVALLGSGDISTSELGAVDLSSTQTVSNKTFTASKQTVVTGSGTAFSPALGQGNVHSYSFTGTGTISVDGVVVPVGAVMLFSIQSNGYSVSWSGIDRWRTDSGIAPTLLGGGAYTDILVYNIAGTLYGARVGDN